MEILKVRQLTKLYKNNRGIKDINITVNQGDIYGFLGPNGAGKTTTMKAITGLCRIDRGEIFINGHSIQKEYEKAMAEVGCIIENCEAYSYMSAYKNLEMTARYHNNIDRRRIDQVLELVGLFPFRKERVEGFSLGMKQRLGLASAMLSRPALLILDEPGNGLDIEGLVEIRNIIRSLAEESKTTFLISSHQINEIQLLCNRIGIISEGRMLLDAYVADLPEEAALEDVYMKHIKKEKVS